MDTVYTYGGGAYIEWAFTMVASIIGEDIYKSILTIGGLIGLFWILLRNTVTINWGDSAKTLMIAVSAYYFMFIPKTNVAIHDSLDYGQIRQVDNVPWVLTRLASVSSTFGHELAKLVDQFASFPDDQQYSKYGLLFGADIIKASNYVTIRDPMLRENTEEFMRKCLLGSIMMGKYSVSKIKNSPNIFTLLDSTMKNTLDFMDWQVKRETYGYSYLKVNCGEAFEKIKYGLQSDESKMVKYIANKIRSTNFFTSSFFQDGGNSDKDQIFKQQIATQAEYFMKISDSSRNILFHNVLRNSLKDATATDAQNYARASSGLQANNMMYIAGELSKQAVVLWRIFFEILLYFGYVLIIPLMMILGAEKRIIAYCKKILELQLWMPLYAILNGMITKIQLLKMQNYQFEGATIENINGINSAVSDLALLAGFGVAMIPFLAKMLMNGFDSLTHMAGTMLSPIMQTAHSTASEVSSGNFNLGSTAIGNHAWSNASANKYDISSVDRRYGETVQQENGMETTNYQNGSFVLNASNMMHQLPFQAEVTNSITNTMSDRALHNKETAMDLEKQSSQHFSNALNKAMQFSEHISSSKELSESFNESNNSEVRNSLEDLMSYNAEVKGGTSSKIGPSIFSASSGMELLIRDQENLSKSLAVLTNASNEDRLNITDNKSKELLEDIRNDFSSYQEKGEMARVRYNVSDSLQEEAAKINENSFSYRKEFGNKFINWLEKPIEDGGAGLSKEEINDVVNPNKEGAEKYIQEFVKTYNNDYVKEIVDKEFYDKHLSNLNQYDRDNKSPINMSSEIETIANSNDLSFENKIDESLKENVDNKLVKNDEDINRSFDENVIKKIGKKYTNASEEIDKIKKLIYNKEEDE